jgi:hypothetical protein
MMMGYKLTDHFSFRALRRRFFAAFDFGFG